MAQYGKKAQQKVKRALHERKQGTLKSGSGTTVKSRKQAIAIGLSEAREEGGKVPSRKSARKKSTTTKTARPATRGKTVRKIATRKSASRK